MKKLVAMALSIVLGLGALSACTTPSESNNGQGSNGTNNAGNSNGNSNGDSNGNNNAGSNSSFDASKSISVVTREDGSGTRSAFVELFKVTDADNQDNITKEAITADETDIMMTNVANNPYAIGYCSLGSLNDSIKPLVVDGVQATVANVKNGTYKIQRPFFIATKGDPTGVTKDFIDFILSAEGQAVVEARGFVAIVDNPAPYAGSKPAGRIVIGGSSSVHPLMDKLREAYLKTNPNATIELQMQDSSAGMTGAMNGTFDIGMASRELKESELAELTDFQIALDGIAVIVNNANPLDQISSPMVKDIYNGTATKWNDVK